MGLSVDFDREFSTAIQQITPAQLQAVANKYLSEPYISIANPQENEGMVIEDGKLVG
jgi:zinc protease